MTNKRRSYSFEHNFKAQKDAPNNAEEVVGALEAIEARDGKLTPEAVLEEAVRRDSPLHDHFEWDDGEAAKRWRLEQARSLIASVRVTIIEGRRRPPYRAFVHVPAEQPHYASSHLAMSNADKRSLILSHALAELRSFQKRYDELFELADIFGAIRRTLEKFGGEDAQQPPPA